MARWLIVASCAWFFVFALAATLVESLFRPSTLAASVVAAGAIYAISAVIPAIIWAFGRFRAQRAVLPLAVWGGLLILTAAVSVVRDTGSELANAMMNIPAFKKSYTESLIRGATTACLRSAKSSAPGISDAQVQALCDCSATEMANSLTPADMIGLIEHKNDPATQAKIIAIRVKCTATAFEKVH